MLNAPPRIQSMSLRVLKSNAEVKSARNELHASGLSSLDGWWPQTAFKLRLRSAPVVGDVRKSWDVLETARFLQAHVERNETVLDIGARGSEMLPVLKKLGYQKLIGVDLDPSVMQMPRLDVIDYRVANFMNTDLADGSCSAVTAISVIEHGYDPAGLFREVARLLRPGGHFIASFDYWPDKLNTDGISLFGMSWRIFSQDDVRQTISDAAGYGLRPAGDMRPEAGTPVIHFEGYDYTFAWLALTKD